MDAGMQLMRETKKKKVQQQAYDAAVERVLNLLVPPPKDVTDENGNPVKPEENAARRRFREDLRAGRLDETTVSADGEAQVPTFIVLASEGMDDLLT